MRNVNDDREEVFTGAWRVGSILPVYRIINMIIAHGLVTAFGTPPVNVYELGF